MAFNRELIYSTLLTRLQAYLSLTSTPALAQPISRRARELSTIGPDEQPACWLVAGDEQFTQDKGYQPKRTMNAHVLLFVRTDNPDVAPTTIIFPLINLVEQAIAWQAVPGQVADITPGNYGGMTNLGGLVSHCKLTRVEIVDGLPSGEGMALLTIEILAYGNVQGVTG